MVDQKSSSPHSLVVSHSQTSQSLSTILSPQIHALPYGLAALISLFGVQPMAMVATLQLYLPDRTRTGELILDHADWVQRAMVLLDALEPGCTTVRANGIWRGTYEGTCVVSKDIDEGFFQRDLTPLCELLRRFLVEANQEQVFVSLLSNGGKWIFPVGGR